MIRRSLRIGIRLGVLCGLAFALFKIVQSRRASPALPEGDDGWAPRVDHPSPSSKAPLVQPTLPERTLAERAAARAADAPAETTAVAPGPSEPFAMVEPDAPARPDPPAPLVEAPLDEGPGQAAGADTAPPSAEAPPVAPPAPPQTSGDTAVEPPSPAPAPATKAAKRTAKRTAKKATKAAKKTAKKATKTAATKTAATKTAATKTAAGKAAAGKAGARKATARKATAAKATRRKAVRSGGTRPAAEGAQAAAQWVAPVDGACPPSHPVKAKLASGIFHLPGMAAYQRTSADRCYPDPQSAEDDGLRRAKR